MTKARTGRDGWRDGKGQIGIDGNKDADFGKMRRRNDPWTVESQGASYVPGDGVRRKDTVKSGQGIDDDEGVGILRNKPEGAGTGGARDIYRDVERNSGDVSESGGTGPIKYGVD